MAKNTLSRNVLPMPNMKTMTIIIHASELGMLLFIIVSMFACVNIEKPIVELNIPKEPLFVGSYIKVPVNITPNSGITIDDLDFVIPAGEKGGLVSLSRDDDFNSANPDIMLLAGYEPGTYELQAVERSSNKVLAKGNFTINTTWGNDQEGPSLWMSGDFELPGIPGAAWGGGSPTQPDNFNVAPAIGTHNIAILLVDTSSQRYNQNDIQNITTLWQDVAFNGRVKNGLSVSTAHYYREVSHNLFNFTGQVFGPVHLPDAWNDYLEDNGNYKVNLWQACATAGDSLINYSNFKYLICVVQSVNATATTSGKSVWPHADSMMAKVAEGDIPLGTLDMPAEGDPFDLSAILTHELGHNLSLGGDVYAWGGHPPQIQAREMDGWDIMANQSGLPHPVNAHRMRVGWLPAKNLKLYNFQSIGGYVDETITLHPAELANPPAGRYSGIEVRIAPGLDYYFEYRVGQTSQIGDRNLPIDSRVLGYEVSYSENLEDMVRRKPVMLLNKDIDGDGPVLDKGQDYKEQDITDPNFPTDFKLAVTDIDGTKADVRIQYGVYSQPDPSIRPWSPPVYKSPDIEIRNERNKVDPKWFNVPWQGNHNTVVAKVTNLGAMNAPSVWVDFYAMDLTLNTYGGKPIKIGEDHKDIPAKQTVEFSTIWMPLKTGHYCIEARIRHYQTPGPNSVIEATEYNNRARSNYDRFISASSSPPSREFTSVKVHNPFNESVRVFIRTIKSSSPLFRTYLEHTWLQLNPGETKDVRLMFEYVYGKDIVWTPNLERYISKPNNVSICAVIQEPNAEREQAPVALGGLTIQVATGRATRIDNFAFDLPTANGRVIAVDTGEPVPGGKVILTLKTNTEEEYHTVEVSQNGNFTVDASGNWDSIQAYYIPIDGYADSESQLKTRP